jgi:hypothetical protein
MRGRERMGALSFPTKPYIIEQTFFVLGDKCFTPQGSYR